MWCSISSSPSTPSPLRPDCRPRYGHVNHRGLVDIRDYRKLRNVLPGGARFLGTMILALYEYRQAGVHNADTLRESFSLGTWSSCLRRKDFWNHVPAYIYCPTSLAVVFVMVLDRCPDLLICPAISTDPFVSEPSSDDRASLRPLTCRS